MKAVKNVENINIRYVVKDTLKEFLCILLAVAILMPGGTIKTASAQNTVVGSIASFELIDADTDKNVIGMIVPKSRLKYIDGAAMYTQFNFRNVKIYVDEGRTMDWGEYYWRVSSISNSSDTPVALFSAQRGILTDIPDPTFPTDYIESTEPTESTEPVDELTDPTEPAGSTNPTEPNDTTNLVDPTDPVFSTEPTEPTETTEPVDPNEPTNPTYPTNPTNETDETESTDPTIGNELEIPTESANFIESAEPIGAIQSKKSDSIENFIIPVSVEQFEQSTVYNKNYYLRAEILSVGTVIVTIEMSADINMTRSITKTFTIQVVDDSKNGEVDATFRKGASTSNLNLNNPVELKMTDTSTYISIASVFGYDYSNLSASVASVERVITSYTWSATVVSNSAGGNAQISATGTIDAFGNTVTGTVTAGSGNRTIYIKPTREGLVDIVFTIKPTAGSFQDIVGTPAVTLNITKNVGNMDFNPTFGIYSEAATDPKDVSIKIEDLHIILNGVKTEIDGAFMSNTQNNNLIAVVTAPINALAGGYDTLGWVNLTTSNPPVKAAKTIAINPDFFSGNNMIYIPLTKSADIDIRISGTILGVTQNVPKTVNVKFITNDDDGKIFSLKFRKDYTEDIYDKKTIRTVIDKDGKTEGDIVLNNFEVYVFDSSAAPTYKRLLTDNEYSIKAKIEKPDLAEMTVYNINDFNKEIIISPKKSGTTKITVTAEIPSDSDDADYKNEKSCQFTLDITNIGVLPENAGKVVSIQLKRDDENQKIYENQTLYLKDNKADALKINIVKVFVSASYKSASNYTEELNHFMWEIEKSENDTFLNIHADEISGITETGEASINIGTEAIPLNGEVGPISLKIKIIPYNSDIEDYDSDKSDYIQFYVIINELGGKFILDIDYNAEKVNIIEGKIEDTYKYYSFNGQVEYMYCLRAVADGAKQSAEKWYPVMGDNINVSKVIPKNANAAVYRVAIRPVEALAEEDNNYSSENRKTIVLNPRRILTSAEKKSVVYKDGKIVLNDEKAPYIEVIYTVGICTTGIIKSINGENGIEVHPKSNPLGNTVSIQFPAHIDESNPENNRFASAAFKVRVPRTAKIPAIKDDGKRGFTGFTAKMSWSATGELNNPESWTQCEKGMVRYENLSAVFGGLQLESNENGDFRILYVKTDATNKILESDILIVKIPEDKY